MRIRSTIFYSNKALKFTKLDGTTDPCLHLCIFSNEVSLITMDDDLHAKLFPLSLKGGHATKWFYKLPYASIESFA